MDSSLQLLTLDEQLTLNPVACQKIAQLSSLLCVASVLGPLEQSKGSLLNKVLFVQQKQPNLQKGLLLHQLKLDGAPVFLIEVVGQEEELQALAILLSSVVLFHDQHLDPQYLYPLASSTKNIEGDLDEIFPTLLWVVRDNLNSSESPKDLMERALTVQRGADELNRLRRQITSTFSNRDCCLLPQESEPSFAEQASLLRKKLISYLRPKRIRNMYLDGEAFVELLRMFVGYINVNMQIDVSDIWDQLIDDQATRILNEAHAIYDDQVQQIKLPATTLDELKQKHKESEQRAIEYMKQKISDQQLQDELHLMCKQGFKQLNQKNEQASYMLCSNFINKEFQSLKKRLNDYKSILEYERDIKLFYQFLLEHGPKTVLKYQVYQEFYNSMMSEGTERFLKNSQIVKQDNVQPKLDSILQEKDRTIQELMDKIREQDKQKSSLLTSVKLLEEQLTVSERNSELLQQELSKQKETLTSQIKQHERSLYVKESEYTKLKALSEQKIAHLNKLIEQNQRKENMMDSSFISTKSEYTHQIKDVQQKYESMLSQLQDRLVLQTDKVAQLQDQLLSLESQNSQLTFRLQQKETRIMDYEQQLSKMSNITTLMTQPDNSQIEEYERQNKKLKDQVEILEHHLREKREKYIQLKNSLEKDYALISQEKQFLEIQLQDAKQQLQVQKRNNEQTLTLLESQNDLSKSTAFSKQYVELKEMHMNEMKQLEQEQEQQKRKLLMQIDHLQNENRLLDSQILAQQNDFTREIANLKTKLLQYEDNLSKLNKDYYILEQSKVRMMKEFEDRYQQKCRLYQQEIEEIKLRNLNEYELMQAKSEEQIQQLRNLYESERQKVEAKFAQDRKIMEDKFSKMIEDLMNECNNNQQDEQVKKLQKRLKQAEQTIQQLQSSAQNGFESTYRQLHQVEQENKELKAQLSKQSSNYYQSAVNSIKEENQMLIQKNEELLLQSTQKDDQCRQLEARIAEVERSKSEALQNLKAANQKERLQLQSQADSLKQKLEDMEDDSIKAKVEFEKQLALVTQENEFHQLKIQELQQVIESLNSKQPESIAFRIESALPSFDLEREIKEQQSKYEKLRQQYKEQEIQHNKLVLELKGEIEQMQQKLSAQQLELKQFASSSPNKKPQTKLGNDDIEVLRERVEQLEQEKEEIKSDHERDKILWDQKFKFMQGQKDQAKQDLAEAMQKFEITITHIQQARQQDFQEQGNSISEMLVTLEKKYQLQVLDLTENHQQTVEAYETRISNLEKALKQYQIQADNSVRWEEVHEKQDCEIEKVRLEYETKLEEVYFQIAEERGLWRQKVQEAEDRYKEAEMRRSNMVFDHEKERAKWSIEKDELNYARLELQEQNQKLEQKKDTLTKEVEKQKSDKKKKLGVIRTRLSPNKSPGTISNVSKLGQSFDTFQQPSLEFTEDNTHKSIHLNPGESFEAYYAKNQNQFD